MHKNSNKWLLNHFQVFWCPSQRLAVDDAKHMQGHISRRKIPRHIFGTYTRRLTIRKVPSIFAWMQRGWAGVHDLLLGDANFFRAIWFFWTSGWLQWNSEKGIYWLTFQKVFEFLLQMLQHEFQPTFLFFLTIFLGMPRAQPKQPVIGKLRLPNAGPPFESGVRSPQSQCSNSNSL